MRLDSFGKVAKQLPGAALQFFVQMTGDTTKAKMHLRVHSSGCCSLRLENSSDVL